MFNKSQSSITGGIVGEVLVNSGFGSPYGNYTPGFSFDTTFVRDDTGSNNFKKYAGYRPGIYNLKSQYNLKSLKNWAKRPYLITFGEVSSTPDSTGWIGLLPDGTVSIENVSRQQISFPTGVSFQQGDFIIWVTTSYSTSNYPFTSSPAIGQFSNRTFFSYLAATLSNPPLQVNYFRIPSGISDLSQYQYVGHPSAAPNSTSFSIRSASHNTQHFYCVIRDLPTNASLVSLVGPIATSSASSSRPVGTGTTSYSSTATYSDRLRFAVMAQRATSTTALPDTQIYTNVDLQQFYYVYNGFATQDSYLSVHIGKIRPEDYSNTYTGSQLDYLSQYTTSYPRAIQNFWLAGTYYEFDLVFNEY